MMLLRGMSIHSRWEPGLLFVGLLIFYVACPVNTPFDSAWYLPTALSILKEGKVNIDEYAPTFHQGHGTIQVNGHWYNDYPLGPALVALPFVAAAELLFRGLAPFSALSPKIARWVDRWRYRSCATGEINLDFWNIPQRVIASILVSIAAVLMFLIASQSLSRPRALLLTLVFALGTSALSTATRALWQHGPSMSEDRFALVRRTRFVIGRCGPRALGCRVPLQSLVGGPLVRSTLPYRRVALSLLSHDSGDWCLDLGFRTPSDRDYRFCFVCSDQFCHTFLWSDFMEATSLERRTCECRLPPQSRVGLERSAILTRLAQGAHDFIA